MNKSRQQQSIFKSGGYNQEIRIRHSLSTLFANADTGYLFMQNTCSTLKPLLTKHAAGEDPMNVHNVHGFLTALMICPAGIDRPEMFDIMLDGKPSLTSDASKQLDSCISSLEDSIDRAFNSEEGFILSCESDLDQPDDSALAEWCTGFMEGHFLAEDNWFTEHEQEVCELLLPLMLASGLFNEEPEFRDILKDPKLTEDMCSQIPEVLMELYLMFNSPEDVHKKK